MKTLLLLAAIMAFGLLQVHGNLWDFRKMIQAVTGKEAVTSYGSYGCHCGLGGKGSPKDATDRCCVAHDCCYYRLQKRGCATKLLAYKFSYHGGKVICDFPVCLTGQSLRRKKGRACSACTNHEPFPGVGALPRGQIAKQDSCRSQLCQCDKSAAYCFAKNRKTYSRKYQFYPNQLCSGKTPRC